MSFIVDLKSRARRLKAEVTALYFAARDSRTPWYAKAFLVAIVAYALSPIDLVPDFIPVLGFVDEIVLLPFAIMLAVKLVPAEVMADCRARAAESSRVNTRAGRIAAAVILLAWIAAIAAIGTWAYERF